MTQWVSTTTVLSDLGNPAVNENKAGVEEWESTSWGFMVNVISPTVQKVLLYYYSILDKVLW